jgi:hypothetical protein
MLVSRLHWIPANPIEYGASASILPAIGCNRIRCDACGEWVRVVHGRAPSDGNPIAPASTYATAAAQLDSMLSIDGLANLYLCRCRWHAERSTQWIEGADDFRPLDLPWRCAGHPQPAWPLHLDGIVIESPWVAETMIERLLRGDDAGRWHPAIAPVAGFGAVRLARLLGASAQRDFAARVAAMLTHAETAVRHGALGFYRLLPAAQGFERVLQLRHKRTLWSAPDPTAPERSLRWTLRLTLDAIEAQKSLR